MIEPPYPIETLPTIGLPANTKSWYFTRYTEAQMWRQLKCPVTQLDKFFSIGGNCLAFRSTTPIHFLRTTWSDVYYKLEFFDWKTKIKEEIVQVNPDPDRFYCICTMYGNPNGTVVITRLSLDRNTILVGFQDHNGIFIAIQPNINPPYENMCKRFLELVHNRTRAQRIAQLNGRNQRNYIPFSQEFCARDHANTYFYAHWCWMCRGVIEKMYRRLHRHRNNIRVCRCRMLTEEELARRGPWNSNQIMKRDPVEFEENGRDLFQCNLPSPRAHADPHLYCLD